MKTITVATFDDKDSANHLQERLAQEGFHAEVVDDTGFQKRRLVNEPRAAFHVNVTQEELLRAAQRLHEMEMTERVMDSAVHCPQCHSGRVEYPQLTRKFYSPDFVSLFMMLGVLEKKYFCQDCHYTWSNEVHPAVERDVLGWAKGK